MSGLDNASTHELLRLYAAILRELFRRGVIRTLNAPAGDLAETLVLRAYGGELAPNSEKSWDVRAADNRKLQVKARVVAAGAINKPVQYSVFRSWNFDAAVFVVLSAETYEVVAAYEIESSTLRGRANVRAWVRAETITMSIPVMAAIEGAVDVTTRVRAALATLDDLPS